MAAFFCGTGLVAAQTTLPADTLLFQTEGSWSPRTNVNAGTVLVYGIDPTTAERIASWKAHGYHTAVMTGVAWGRYAPYLRGDFDGKQHWDETQQEKSGKLILHGGREVPYVSPSEAYGRYLAQGVLAALDAGAEEVVLEEPEFWVRAGWSESFKRSWTEQYGQPWQPPDSSPDAQYRASELKYLLYRRALKQVFDAVKAYGTQHGRTIPCYVATHSLINYAQWNIVSPEFSLLGAGADGFIGQVWTGTAREPNVYGGVLKERTFETAFLEYGALQNIARSSAKPIWYLNDPIEDNPNHSWVDYRRNWESTLTASLLQPAVARYEVLPWPNRIFDETALYPSAEPQTGQPAPPKTRIPDGYVTELQTVFHALGEMGRSNGEAHWEQAGTQGLGVLVSDTLMFQRGAPDASDAHLSQVYGLALPPLLHGMPVEPVQMEGAVGANGPSHALDAYRLLLLSYEGQKPPSQAFHQALAAWVRTGGALVVVDDDKDPYNAATGWWNAAPRHDATPRADLFRALGLPLSPAGLQRVGKGVVLYSAQSPSALAHSAAGAAAVLQLLQTAADGRGMPLQDSTALVLRRGPYVVAAGLDKASATARAVSVQGELIDLFDPALTMHRELTLKPGSRALLLDVAKLPAGPPHVVAASARIASEKATGGTLVFQADGLEDTEAVVRVLAGSVPAAVLVDGHPLPAPQVTRDGRTVLLRFHNRAKAQEIRMEWR